MESVLIIRITYLDTDRILIPGVNGVCVSVHGCVCLFAIVCVCVCLNLSAHWAAGCESDCCDSGLRV